MYIARIPNRGSRPTVLVREGWREGAKTRQRTVANLTHLPEPAIEAVGRALKGERWPSAAGLSAERTRPHGHVAAVLGSLRKSGLERALDRRPSRMRSLAVGLVASRILSPGSKLATSRGWCAGTLTSTLGEELGVTDAGADELYAAMDWLLERQPAVESRLARLRLAEGALVLYDVTSTWLEGSKCALGRRGYSRDGKRGKLQVVFGLLCDALGCPVAGRSSGATRRTRGPCRRRSASCAGASAWRGW